MQDRLTEIAIQEQNILLRLPQHHSQVGAHGALAFTRIWARDHNNFRRFVYKRVKEIRAHDTESLRGSAIWVCNGYQTPGEVLDFSFSPPLPTAHPNEVKNSSSYHLSRLPKLQMRSLLQLEMRERPRK